MERNNILLGSALTEQETATAADVVENYLRDEDACKACATCNASTITRSTVPNPPDILFVSVNRLNYSTVNGDLQISRINTKVTPPDALEVDLRKDGSEKVWYKLYGIVYHQGAIRAGHYFCAVKGPDGEWVKVDDTNVESFQSWRSPSHCQKATLFAYKKMDGKPETIDETSGTAEAANGPRTELEATIELKGRGVSWDLQKSLDLPERFLLNKQKVKFMVKLTSTSGDVYEASADTILQLKKQAPPIQRKRTGSKAIEKLQALGRKKKK